MVMRIYTLAWMLVLAVAAISYMAGLFSATTLPIFGFVISTLVFMGFVVVLPVLLDDHFSPKIHPAGMQRRLSDAAI